jgi:hypothetical protein
MHAVFGTAVGVQAAAIAAQAANTAATVTVTASNAALTAAIVSLTAAVVAQTTSTDIGDAEDLLPFADGGSPPLGVPSIVGERGPELFVPHEAGAIIPHHMLKGYADGAGLADVSRSGFSSSYAHTTTFSGDMHIHLNGGSSPRAHAEQVLRELPKVAKARGAQWSPYSK